MNWLWVFLGGGLGSMARYAISKGSLHLFKEATFFPWATLISNTLACGLLAFLVYSIPDKLTENHRLFWIVGVCGGFSTFSTFSLENWILIEQKAWPFVAANILVSLGLGISIMMGMSRLSA